MSLDNEALAEAIKQQDDLTTSLLPDEVHDGILIPLKTGPELEEEHAALPTMITRCPVSSASGVIKQVYTFHDREFIGDRPLLAGEEPFSTSKEWKQKEKEYYESKSWTVEDIAKTLPHLRRCCKPCDLPPHIRCRFMDEDEKSRQIHNGKAPWVYIALGLMEELDQDEVRKNLSKVEGLEDPIFLAQIPLPMCPPTSQTLASLWCSHFWPTVYRKTNPQGPHPSQVSRATEELSADAAIWMSLAFSIAEKGHAAGLGEAMGACIVMRTDEGPKLVALAADARWHNGSFGGNGNPMAHAVHRAVSMVAQKLVRAENREPNGVNIPQILEFDCFQDAPLLDDERKVFDAEHPQPDGYLCHGLELYTTHEPCTMCSMAVLHSRMAKAVFTHRMPLTGGLSAEDRILDKDDYPDADESLGGGKGLGLFWRRELNWSLLAWEWAHIDCYKAPPVDPRIHV